jgi:hypothetical protein
MDADTLEQARRLYAHLLQETHDVAERLRAQLRQLRERFPDLPPEVLGGEVIVRVDPPHAEKGPVSPPSGEAGPM